MKYPLSLFAILLFAAAATFAQPPGDAPRVGGAELYLAKDNGEGRAGDAATGFLTTDVPIYCVVQLDSYTPVTVKMNLVAVKVPGVKPGTHVVSTSYTTRSNQSRVNFTGRPDGKWIAGQYRVDIFIGNAPAVSRNFTVSVTPPAKPSDTAADPRTEALLTPKRPVR